MSDEKPNSKELSAFGKCVIDKHYESSAAKLKELNPAFAQTLGTPEQGKEKLLAGTGIDTIIEGRTDVVNACSNNLPSGMLRDLPNLKKAARLPRT